MDPVAGAALIRVAAYPTDLVLPPWPDLTTGSPDEWREWLGTAWALPGFAAVVTFASSDLAGQISKVVTGEVAAPQRLRRLVETVVRYLLRWTTRATPFGAFAGVAPVTFGSRAAVRIGDAHHAVARPDGEVIAEQVVQAEQDFARLRTVAVVTNSLGFRQGERWVLPCARTDGARRFNVEVRLTDQVRTAIEAAQSPVGFAELAAKIAGTRSVEPAERLLADLVRVGVLVSQLRPAMTDIDPAAHLTHYGIILGHGSRTAVDLRADAAVTLPPAVLQEAGRAAETLTAVAPRWPAWVEYHEAFIERWGPGAAVPLREVVNVLGLPAGYRGSTRRAPAGFNARDRALGQLAQQAALDGCDEVVLDDELIDRIRGDDDRPPVPHTELRFTLAADTPTDLDRGAFTLTVVSGSRHAGVGAARFLHLLTAPERASFDRAYEKLSTALPGASTVQLSGPPLDDRLTAVARIPELLPVLPVGDFHPQPPWTLDDLAVAGDGRRLWLVSSPTGQPVEPLLFNSVLLPGLQQPMVRFLAEIWTAWTAPCSRFDWGHAGGLPFLPRLRRGRSVLHPARWIVDRTALPARSAGWSQWSDAWQRHRDQRRLPPQILVGDDDVRLRLDLDNPAHLAVLRDHLGRNARTVLTEAPGPAGWIDDRPAELLLTLTASAPPGTSARASRPVSTIQHRPGRSPWLEAHLSGRIDDVLTDLAARPVGYLPAGWWFLRYPSPEPHLRLRVPIIGVDRFADVAERLADWTAELDDAVHDLSLHTYRPETRHGVGATLAAAEAVFAADSHAVVHRLGGDRQSATASGMIAIVDNFTGEGVAWITAHVPHRTGLRLDRAQLERAGIRLHNETLAAALPTYRALVDSDGLDADQVLADLLHLHHARMIGVDIASEQHCLRLARAVARSVVTRQPS